MNLKSESTSVQASAEKVFDFLSQASNIELILPKEEIKDFKSDEAGCSFKVKGGILIPLIYTEKNASSMIGMKSDERAPFQYTLTINIFDKGESCEGFIEFNAEINMFMKMMVEKPLLALVNQMTINLQKHFQ